MSTLKRQHAQAIEIAKLKHFVLYSLRQTCLSRWAGSLHSFKLKVIEGHGSIVTAQRYVHVNDEELFPPWFRHVLHAPGFYTGYGVKTLPGIREAIEERHWKEADEQIGFTSKALIAYADWLQLAASSAGTE